MVRYPQLKDLRASAPDALDDAPCHQFRRRRGSAEDTPGGPVKVAYVVSAYPRASHSFIRREIRALESLGVEVVRFSVRPLDLDPAWAQTLVTEADREEHERTRAILSAGVMTHASALMAEAVRRPGAFARALSIALTMGWRSERGLLRNLAYLAMASVLVRWLRKEDVAHLHAHFGNNAPAIALLCRQLGGPTFSFTVHGQEDFDTFREKASDASFLVAISSFGRAQYYHRLDQRDWSKVHVVRCGLDPELLTAPLTPVPEARRLICVARLSPEKGHAILLEAAARLAAEGMSFELLLAGDGPLRAAIEQQLKTLGLQDHVRLCGWISEEEVRQEIVASRALLVTSFSEGLPVVVMEALALGRPAICSAISGIPELIVPGATGWLVPAASVEALARAMREALEAPPAQLEAMGRAGAALVAERHDARREARRLLELFRSATEATAPSGLAVTRAG